MQIKLSDHFGFGKLIRFVLPTIVMMIFTSIYSVVDGFFVSNFAGKTAFAAINLIMPVLMIIGAIGFMFGAGGSALVAKTLGEQRKDKANKIFSLLVVSAIVLGVVFSTAGIIFIRPISTMLGAEGKLLELCVLYGRIILIAMPFFMLQNIFQSFFVVAEKPKLGLAVTVIAGVSNIVLDALFIAVFKWGITGAAVATGFSQFLGGFIPLVYFASKNSSTIRLVKPAFDGKALIKTATNGSSEFVTNISMSVVAALYNFQLMKYSGENGIAAYGVIMYVSFIFVAIFLGFSIGVAPIIGYNFGAKNHTELKNVFKKCILFVIGAGMALTAVALALSAPLSKVFVGYDAELYALTLHGFRLYAASFLLCGFGVFGSAFFTALNNGIVSAVISFLRILVFQTVCITVLPIFFEIEGIWWAIVVAEAMSFIVALTLMLSFKKKYGY
ncbi:MAG: MATE family efflux transporter [Clostridia bacterium]|nr:MATE family efflux transporter [Clostridia bacterium]